MWRRFRGWIPCTLAVAILFSWVEPAEARDKDDCQRAWSQAVRSYLTQNRRADPKGKVPATLDDEELAAQAWMSAFAPACDLESEGRKIAARIEAAMIGVGILAKLDPKGCARFMQYYMDSERPKDACDMAARGSGSADLRAAIERSIPEKK